MQRVLGQRRQPHEQLAGPLQPTARLGPATELATVERQLEREARGRSLVTRLARKPVRAFVRSQRRRAVHLPARRHAQPLECLHALPERERRLEERARLGPRRPRQRLRASPDQRARLLCGLRHPHESMVAARRDPGVRDPRTDTGEGG